MMMVMGIDLTWIIDTCIMKTCIKDSMHHWYFAWVKQDTILQVHNDCRPSLSSLSFQNTFADLSQVLREEENFNPLKFADKMKDVKNTKRADMISKMMIYV